MSEIERRPGVYVLSGQRQQYLYKGACRDLVARLADHFAGRVARTRGMRPLRLEYFEYCEDYSTALRRERFLKSGVGRAWLKKTLENARVAKWQTQGTSCPGQACLRQENPLHGRSQPE